MKVSVLALLAAPVLVLGSSWGSHNSGAGVAHHQNVARGIKAHPASLHKRGPAKARHCAARASSLSAAAAASTTTTTTTTTEKKTTTTTTTHHHTTTTTEKPKATDNSNDDSGSSGGTVYTGDGTFYSTGLNACGTVDQDTDMIAALAHEPFDNYPGANGNSNENPICEKRVRACRQSTGKCVTVRITDRCGGCGEHSLDFSPSAFKQLASFDVGRFHDLEWTFV